MYSVIDVAIDIPSKVDVPLPTSSRIIKEFSVALFIKVPKLHSVTQSLQLYTPKSKKVVSVKFILYVS